MHGVGIKCRPRGHVHASMAEANYPNWGLKDGVRDLVGQCCLHFKTIELRLGTRQGPFCSFLLFQFSAFFIHSATVRRTLCTVRFVRIKIQRNLRKALS